MAQVVHFMLCLFYPIINFKMEKALMPEKDFSHSLRRPSQIFDFLVLPFTPQFNLLCWGGHGAHH